MSDPRIPGDGSGPFRPMVFEPGAISRLNGPRWSREVAPTLRANAGDNHPAVLQEADDE